MDDTEDGNNENLKAIYDAARSIQSAAAQAVAELTQLVTDNPAIPRTDRQASEPDGAGGSPVGQAAH
jgi:hypothetical protein